MECIIRQKRREQKVPAVSRPPQRRSPLRKRVRRNNEIRTIRAYKPPHRPHHHPRKCRAHHAAPRRTPRKAEEHIVQIRDKTQHHEINTLHEVVNHRDVARHKIHNGNTHVLARTRSNCRMNRLRRPRMSGADGSGQNENMNTPHDRLLR